MTTVPNELAMGIARWIARGFASLSHDSRKGVVVLLDEYVDADDEDRHEIVETIVELFLDEPVEYESLN